MSLLFFDYIKLTIADGTRSWEPRASFVDRDGTTNDVFQSWCEQNRTPTGPPKKRTRAASGTDNEQSVRGRGKRGRPRGSRGQNITSKNLH